MCIAYLSLGHPHWPVLVAANRDEFHHRPTAPLGPWPEHPGILAGRDLQAGGTWMGCTRDGRFALLTNYREPAAAVPAHAPSRGALVRDYLLADADPKSWMSELASKAQALAGYNLIVGSRREWWYYSNRDPQPGPHPLAPGRYVVSNHLLDTPWPKARRLRAALDALPAAHWVRQPEDVLARLRDTTPATDGELPQTGLAPAFERLLSSPFIISPDYGTRSSSILAMGIDGSLLFCEQSHDAAGRPTERHDWRINR
ncbi:NRDE family protein [Castellaniella sp.]|uniref:NRDE family protein n=1 Tax=Castellaniella sp. TaxID=1955812 RepID=UPI003563F38B